MKLSIYKSIKFTSILLEQDSCLRIKVLFTKVVSMDQLVFLMLTLQRDNCPLQTWFSIFGRLVPPCFGDILGRVGGKTYQEGKIKLKMNSTHLPILQHRGNPAHYKSSIQDCFLFVAHLIRSDSPA